MPITIQIPAGSLTRDEKAMLVGKLSDTLLELNNATQNPFVRKNLIVAITEVDIDNLFADSVRVPWVNITLRVPEISLDNMEVRRKFTDIMTDFQEELFKGKIARDRFYINMVHGDGFWGIGGACYSPEELGEVAMAAIADVDA